MSTLHEEAIPPLHDRYANSIYGIHHAEQPLRYYQYYGYDRTQMLLDLGDDVHPVRHMSYTEAQIVRPLVATQNTYGDERFDVEQTTAIRIAALFHDIGECEHAEIYQSIGLRIGDLAWDVKTDEDGASEALIRKHVYSKLYTDLSEPTLEAVDDIVDHKEGTFSREAFYTAERLGYYRTGVTAGAVALRLAERHETKDEFRLTQLGRLAMQVTNDHRPFLQANAKRFPYLDDVLKASARTDDRIQSKLGEFVTVGAK